MKKVELRLNEMILERVDVLTGDALGTPMSRDDVLHLALARGLDYLEEEAGIIRSPPALPAEAVVAAERLKGLGPETRVLRVVKIMAPRYRHLGAPWIPIPALRHVFKDLDKTQFDAALLQLEAQQEVRLMIANDPNASFVDEGGGPEAGIDERGESSSGGNKPGGRGLIWFVVLKEG